MKAAAFAKMLRYPPCLSQTLTAAPDQNARRTPRESAGQSQVPSGGRDLRNLMGGGQQKAASRGKQCLPSRKPTADLQAQMPAGCCRGRRAGGTGRRGGASLPPSGRVVASQTARAQGGHASTAEGVSKGTGILPRGRREEEGDLFKLGGWASGKKRRNRRNRLMLCRTPRVFLSGGITSTFRQEQELGGKQQHGLTAREVIKGDSVNVLLCQPFITKRGVLPATLAGERD